MAKRDLSFEGCNFLRQRLILSTLSGKTVKIKRIRSKDDNPGLRGENLSKVMGFRDTFTGETPR